MIHLFGRNFNEVGDSNTGLLLKTDGPIKIQWAKNKFIDLLDSNGALNFPVKGFYKEGNKIVSTANPSSSVSLKEILDYLINK